MWLSFWLYAEECASYNKLDDQTRLPSKEGGSWNALGKRPKQHCDSMSQGVTQPGFDAGKYCLRSPDWKGKGWYRFTAGPKGRVAFKSELPVFSYSANYQYKWTNPCTTYYGGYLDGGMSSLPTRLGETKKGTVRFIGRDHVQHNNYYDLKIRITKCPSFLVFELPDTPDGIRYCAA